MYHNTNGRGETCLRYQRWSRGSDPHHLHRDGTRGVSPNSIISKEKACWRMPGLGFVLGGPRVDPWGGCTFFFPFYLSIFDDDSGAGILEFSCTFRTVVTQNSVCVCSWDTFTCDSEWSWRLQTRPWSSSLRGNHNFFVIKTYQIESSLDIIEHWPKKKKKKSVVNFVFLTMTVL